MPTTLRIAAMKRDFVVTTLCMYVYMENCVFRKDECLDSTYYINIHIVSMSKV